MMTDQTVTQAWLIAIPSVLTALSTWYNKKKIEKSDSKTGAAVDAASDDLAKKVKALEDKVKELETVQSSTKKAVDDTRDIQVKLSMKHTETVNALQSEISKARTTLLKLVPPIPPTEDPGKVATVDAPPQPLGKVIIKP